MPDLPDGMMQLDKPVDDVFKPDEPLYRRVPHESWDEDRVNIDAIDLPDMSVNRGKYSEPQWVRLIGGEYHGTETTFVKPNSLRRVAMSSHKSEARGTFGTTMTVSRGNIMSEDR